MKRSELKKRQREMKARNVALRAPYKMPLDALFRERFFALCADCGWDSDRTQRAFFAISFGPWIQGIRHDLRMLDYLRAELPEVSWVHELDRTVSREDEQHLTVQRGH
jgi:hypothetical protein